jgi:hypothetical protein
MPVRANQVATAIAFLSMCEPTKTGRISSYSLKHAAERWGARNSLCSYITNGALITAALRLGLVVEEYRDCWPSSPNALIGVRQSDFRRLTEVKK